MEISQHSQYLKFFRESDVCTYVDDCFKNSKMTSETIMPLCGSGANRKLSLPADPGINTKSFSCLFLSSACGSESDLYSARYQPYQSDVLGLWRLSQTRGVSPVGSKVTIHFSFKNYEKQINTQCCSNIFQKVKNSLNSELKNCDITI